MEARLPVEPLGDDLEDLVAGVIQAGACYVEKSIKDPNKTFELDIVASKYSSGAILQFLVEVKSGSWHCEDVFKLLGQMTYLNIHEAYFIHATDENPAKTAALNTGLAKHGLHLIRVQDFESAALRLSTGLPIDEVDPLLINTAWWTYWVEREFIQRARKERVGSIAPQGARALIDYYDLCNSAIFFENDPRYRLRELTQAYKAHPRLSLGIASEIDGKGYNPESPDSNSKSFREALFRGEQMLLQAAFYVEHRARLAILKASVDYCLTLKSGDRFSLPEGVPMVYFSSLDTLRKMPDYWLYPVFWQLWMWCWGGFIIDDTKDDELKRIAGLVGLPESSIEHALKAFDILFSTNGSWRTKVVGADCELLKLMPIPLMGIGVWNRVYRLKDENASYEMLTSNPKLQKLLGVWFSSGYKALPERSKKPVTPEAFSDSQPEEQEEGKA